MPGRRNPSKQEARQFAEIYLFEAGRNASKAAELLYEREGKQTNGRVWRQIGYQLLHHAKTQEALEQLKEEHREMFEASRDKIMAKLNDMIDSDDYSPKIQLDAIDKLARIGGFYNDSLEMKGNQTINVTLTD